MLLYYIFIFIIINNDSSTDYVTDDFIDLNYFEVSRVFVNQSQNSLQFMEEDFTNENRSLRVTMTIRNTHVLLKDHSGQIILNKSINKYLYHNDLNIHLDNPNITVVESSRPRIVEGKLLRRWNREKEIIAFLHIGKFSLILH